MTASAIFGARRGLVNADIEDLWRWSNEILKIFDKDPECMKKKIDMSEVLGFTFNSLEERLLDTYIKKIDIPASPWTRQPSMADKYGHRLVGIGQERDKAISAMRANKFFIDIVREQRSEQEQALYNEGMFKVLDELEHLKEPTKERWKKLNPKRQNLKVEQCFTPSLKDKKVLYTLNKTSMYIADEEPKRRPGLKKRLRSYRTR